MGWENNGWTLHYELPRLFGLFGIFRPLFSWTQTDSPLYVVLRAFTYIKYVWLFSFSLNYTHNVVVVVGFKSSCLLVGPGTIGDMPFVGSF